MWRRCTFRTDGRLCTYWRDDNPSSVLMCWGTPSCIGLNLQKWGGEKQRTKGLRGRKRARLLYNFGCSQKQSNNDYTFLHRAWMISPLMRRRALRESAHTHRWGESQTWIAFTQQFTFELKNVILVISAFGVFTQELYWNGISVEGFTATKKYMT